jgi:flagellar biosynthesis component FlhA
LKEAVAALRRAVELTTDKSETISEYATRLERLEGDLLFVHRYGESALNLTPIPKPIRAFLQADWLPFILTPGKLELSEEMDKKINEMRQHIQGRYGIIVPGGNFTTIEEAGALPGDYYFRLMERNVTVDGGRVPLGKKFAHATREQLAALGIESEAPLAQHSPSYGFWIAEADWAKAAQHGLELWGATDYLLRHLEAVLEQNLGEFMNHQVTASLLTESAKVEAPDIGKLPQKLTALTVVLRHLLHERLPIAPFDDIRHRFLELDQRGANVHMIIDDLKSLQAGRKPARIW